MATRTANGMHEYAYVVKGKTLDNWVNDIHRYLSDNSGWVYQPLKPGSFGYENILFSFADVAYAIDSGTRDLEVLAAEVHSAWKINYEFWRDNSPFITNELYIKPFNPLGDERRNLCASRTYDELPEDEKQKDRIVAKYILENY
jgi:hypothetical protein